MQHLIYALTIATALMFSAPFSYAQTNQYPNGTIALLVDTSSSIEDYQMELQFNSYAKVLSQMMILDGVYFEAITFDSTATLLGAGSANDVALLFADAVITGAETRGTTCLGAAIAAVERRLPDLPKPVVVDISGDGQENCSARGVDTRTEMFTALDRLEAAGVIVNTLYIHSVFDTHRYEMLEGMTPEQFYRRLTRGGGFTITAKGWMDFELALYEKLIAEVAMLK